MTWGTLSTLDLLASNAAIQTVADIGEQTVFGSVDTLFRVHNDLVAEQARELMDQTTEQLLAYGGGDSMTMGEIDQFGTPDVQKVSVGSTVGFPLRKYGRGLGWTRDYFERTTMAEFGKQVQAIFDADLLTLQSNIRKAFYTPTNTTFRDRLWKNIDLPIKALVNADSAAIPIGPNGETFTASSHTHYRGASALNNASLDALILAVLEHYAMGSVRVIINRANEATVRALTGFNPVLDARIVAPTTLQRAAGELDQRNLQNRMIGVYDNGGGAAEIWVKPWAISGYQLAYNVDAPKPLMMRVPPGNVGGGGNLRLASDWEQYPLRARTYEREYGVAVFERVNGAVLDVTHSGTYTAPTGL
jgi:hypothetical protein